MAPSTDFFHAIVAADRERAVSAVRHALAAGDAATVYAQVVQEALYEVGLGWQSNRLSVAQEHAATATAQFALGAIFPELPRAEPTRGTALVTSVSGERHQVGLHMIADVLTLNGWNARFLGSDVPRGALLDAVDELAPDVVALGVTMPANLPELEAVVAGIRARSGGSRIVVGGQAVALLDAEALGADAVGGDVRDVCGLLETLVA